MSGGQREAAATRAATLAAARERDAERYRERIAATWNNSPMPVERMMHELADAVPPNTIIADEAVTSRPAVNRAFDFEKPGDIYGIRGGALGWAMPGALGVKLAHPDRPVLAVVGDGASMYTVQALWTASRYNIPVVYAICNNQAYRILKVNMEVYLRDMLDDRERASDYVGMDFANRLDLAMMAQAMGVHGERVDDPRKSAQRSNGHSRAESRRCWILRSAGRCEGCDTPRYPGGNCLPQRMRSIRSGSPRNRTVRLLMAALSPFGMLPKASKGNNRTSTCRGIRSSTAAAPACSCSITSRALIRPLFSSMGIARPARFWASSKSK